MKLSTNLIRRTFRFTFLVLLLPFLALAKPASGQPLPADPALVESFLDGMFRVQNQSNHLAGAVITIVKDGEIYINKGYGYADFEHQTKVDPDKTLFRIASISKPFTWTAVMQLVEQGKLDLDADINSYLKQFQIPDTYPQVITMKHLMAHTAGFEDLVLDLGRRDANDLLPLGEFLKDNLPERVRAPGLYSSYSNHSTALAAHIVEVISGENWSDYIEQHILKPLGMKRTVVRHPMPEVLRVDLAKPYYRSQGKWKQQDFIHWQIYPAALISITGADMARFMMAHLDDGSYQGGRILKPETVRQMRGVLYRARDESNAFLHGFYESSRNDTFIYGHGGDLNAFHSNLMLIPEAGIGFFISLNSDHAANTRSDISSAFIEQYFPALPDSSPVPAKIEVDLAAYAGNYVSLRHSYSDFAKLVLLVDSVNVKVAGDGQLIVGMANSRYIPVAEDTFVSFDSARSLAKKMLYFDRDENGDVGFMSFGRYAGANYEKLNWYQDTQLHHILLGTIVIICTSYLVYWPVRFFRRRFYGVITVSLSKWVYLSASALALVTLASLVYLGSQLGNTAQFYFEVPQHIEFLLALMVVLACSIPFWLLLTANLWRDKQGMLSERINMTVLSGALCLFLIFGWYWNLLDYFL